MGHRNRATMNAGRLGSALALTITVAGTGAPALGAPAARRIAIVIGNNEGGAGFDALLYAEADALAMADVLHSHGRFEKPVVMLGRSAPELLEVFGRANLAGGPGSLLLVYYSGHADADGLRLGDTMLTHDAFKRLVTDLPVDTVLTFVDACHAGILTGAKGGSAEVVTVDAAFVGDRETRGRAIIAAASAAQKAHEYADVRGSLFTSALIRGLLGAADSSGDHQVSLSEAYDYAYARTRNESALRGTFQRPTYQWALEGSGDIILTRLPAVGGYIHFDADATGRIEVRNARTEKVVAQVLPTDPRPFRLNVGPGVFTLHEPLGPRLQRVYTAVVEPGRDSLGWRSTGAYHQAPQGQAKGSTPVVASAGYQLQDAFARDAGFDHVLYLSAGRPLQVAAPVVIGVDLSLGIGRYSRTADGREFNGAVTQGVTGAYADWLPLLVGRLAWQTTLSLGGGVAYQALMAADQDARHLVALGRATLATGPAFLFDDWQISVNLLSTLTAFNRDGPTLDHGWGARLLCGLVWGD